MESSRVKETFTPGLSVKAESLKNALVEEVFQ